MNNIDNNIYKTISKYVFKKNNINFTETNLSYTYNNHAVFSPGISCNENKNKNKRKFRSKRTTNKIKYVNNIDNTKIFLESFVRTFLYSQSTHKLSYKNIINTFYVNKEDEILIKEMFYEIQKTYYTLLNFFNKIKYSRIKKFDNKYDLLMNPLDNTSENLKLTLIEDNVKYVFKLSDILSIVNDSLTNCDDYFSPSVKPIKNPYTNIPFKIHNLYNIYFKIKQSNYIMPSLLNNLFMDNFNIALFSDNNSVEIRDKGIINYYNNVNNTDLYKKINPFLSICKIVNPGFILSSDYPVDELMYILKPFLQHYLICRYSLNLSKVSYQFQILIKKLYCFFKYNNLFGRTIVKLIKVERNDKVVHKKTKYINKKYIAYKNININNIDYYNYYAEKLLNKIRYSNGLNVLHNLQSPISYYYYVSRNIITDESDADYSDEDVFDIENLLSEDEEGEEGEEEEDEEEEEEEGEIFELYNENNDENSDNEKDDDDDDYYNEQIIPLVFSSS